MRKTSYSTYTSLTYKLAINDKNEFLSKFQLLCANCNWIKRHTNNEFSNQYS